MALAAIGGFATGFAQGIKLRSDLDDAEERRRLAKEQSEREGQRLGMEKERLGFERARFNDEERRRNALADQEAELSAIDDALRSGSIFDYTPGKQAKPAAIANPAAEGAATPAAAPAPRAAIAVPGAAPAAPGAPKDNGFMVGGEGRYENYNAAMDRYYELKGAALQRWYQAKGDMEGAMQVPEKIRALRDLDWSRKVGTSLAAMAGGAPGAKEAFAKVYGLVNDGWELDPTKGQFDPNKGWVGLERVNGEGQRETFNLSQDQAFQIAAKFKKPEEVIKYLDEQATKRRTEAREDTKVKNDTTRARAAESEAGARWAQVRINRDRAVTDRTAAEDKARTETLLKLFPNAGKALSIEDKVGKDEKQVSALEAAISADTVGLNTAQHLFSLNPKVPAQVVAGAARELARGKNLPGGEENGRKFVTYGTTKIFF